MNKEKNLYDIDAGERKYYFFEEDYEAIWMSEAPITNKEDGKTIINMNAGEMSESVSSIVPGYILTGILI